MKQNEITEKTPLLDRNGIILSPGYCIYNNYIYNRDDVKAKPLRIKEWDFYNISDKLQSLTMTSAICRRQPRIRYFTVARRIKFKWCY